MNYTFVSYYYLGSISISLVPSPDYLIQFNSIQLHYHSYEYTMSICKYKTKMK